MVQEHLAREKLFPVTNGLYYSNIRKTLKKGNDTVRELILAFYFWLSPARWLKDFIIVISLADL